ncbi:helix-turn-helix transcriptional regulator, partial [uncultured Thiodictyon sp.]|uniref:helix-turn-helix domain-containing protein n=1 Tax=uncultured Thiodictyon sp. TaxID=1846217 RepID=UPI0025DD329E
MLKRFQHIQPQDNKEEYNLSLREKEVLSLLVDGLSYKMIAAKLNITYDTVRAHIKKIYEKLHDDAGTFGRCAPPRWNCCA